ncbi:MAG: hypothetical protein GXP26_12925 [Planctomycetes bacterium]|nr:hypothetical protein [Planctomycetota bacterium]
MEDRNLFQSLGQVSGGEAAQVFREHLRGFVLKMICDVMASEVEHLCGPKHQPTGSELYRAGSSSGRVLVDGQREEVVRPRVRQQQADGSTSEVALTSYESASSPEELQASILSALMAGVSTREISDVKPHSPGVGRSNVSRLWQSAGQKFVEQLRSQSLSEQDWTVLMLDGIRLSKDELAIVAIGHFYC